MSYIEENDTEKLVFDEKEEQAEELDNSEERDYEVTTQGTDWTLEVLYKKIEKKDILIPNFQRKLVWSEVMKSKLIDSFLKGFPVPNIFLYKNSENQLEVIDGQQRLWTIKEFFENKFALKKTKWEGKRFSDLAPSDRLKLEDSVIRATIISSITPENPEIIFRIFERLNTGGMKLYDQEIRNGVWGGNLNNVLVDLNNYENWRKLIGSEKPHNRLADVEMILRFFALVEKWTEYKKPMNEFLTKYLSKNRKDEKKDLQKLFIDTIDIIEQNLDGDAFRLEKNFNKAFFDAVSVGIAVCLREDGEIKNVHAKWNKLKESDELRTHISEATTNSGSVKRRIEIAIETFKNA